MTLRLTLRGYALSLSLRQPWRLLAGLWAEDRTAWLRIGPLAVLFRAPRWDGDQR